MHSTDKTPTICNTSPVDEYKWTASGTALNAIITRFTIGSPDPVLVGNKGRKQIQTYT